MKLNSYLLKSTVVAALGGLLFGFDTAVIAGTTHALAETFRLSPAALGMTSAAARSTLAESATKTISVCSCRRLTEPFTS